MQSIEEGREGGVIILQGEARQFRLQREDGRGRQDFESAWLVVTLPLPYPAHTSAIRICLKKMSSLPPNVLQAHQICAKGKRFNATLSYSSIDFSVIFRLYLLTWQNSTV